MRFLYPWALAFGLLGLVPLALHLLRRDTRQRIAFPALRYLATAQRRYAHLLRARDRLLLAARILLVILLASTAAAPLLGLGEARDHWPTDVVIVVDNSASMARRTEGRSLLQTQLDRVASTLSAASSGDRFWIVPSVGPPVAIGASAEVATQALSGIGQTDGPGDLLMRAQEALHLLPGGGDRPRELQLYTDLQASALEGSPITVAGFAVLVSATTDESPNGFVSVARVADPWSRSAAGAFEIVARVDRYAPHSTARGEPVDLRLVLDGETAALLTAEWGSTAVFRLPYPGPGQHRGKVEMPANGLRADDSRHFTFRVAPRAAVEHQGPATSFLARAIETLRAGGRIGDQGAPVLVLEELPAVGQARAATGASRARVLVPPAESTDVPRFNQLLASLGVPWKLEAEPAVGELRLTGDGSVPGLAAARVSRRYLFRPTDGDRVRSDTVLVRADDGEAWLLRGEARGAPFLLLGSPLTSEASSLPVSAAMLPFVEALLLRWSSPAGRSDRAVIAGEATVLPARSDSVVTPQGIVWRTDGDVPFVPERAGIYEILGETPGGSGAFAANVAASESDPASAGPELIGAVFRGAPVRVAYTARDWSAVAYHRRRGRDARPGLLAAALVLLIVQSVLASPGSSSRATSGSPRAGGRVRERRI